MSVEAISLIGGRNQLTMGGGPHDRRLLAALWINLYCNSNEWSQIKYKIIMCARNTIYYNYF